MARSSGQLILIAPLVLAHHEELYWLVGREFVLLALEEILVPRQRDAIFVELARCGPEIDGADRAARQPEWPPIATSKR